ncbi:hypothetical protein KR067_009414 [Drosophila pandora]|nr:hypothetical protein KR067_009414 [Drosophila pandora]
MQSTSNGSVAAAAAAAGAAAAIVDERTRLLSEEEETTITVTSSPPLSSSPAIAVSIAPPTTLPLVHTTTIQPSHQQQQQQQNNNNNTNNNNAVRNVVEKTNKNQNQNNNNATGEIETETNTTATTTTTATTVTTTSTADEEDLSSDLSDKFPRPQKKPGKLSKLGTKQVGLKRVSFGSSKGSMVETLVFETPTPLSEHVESTFGFDAAAAAAFARDAAAAAAAGQPQSAATHPHPSLLPLSGSYSGDYAKANMDDSGIEVQEESERSIVRVSIYQSSQPQQICPPAEYLLESIDGGLAYNYNLDYETAVAAMQQQHQLGLGAAYDRQQSTDSGWDNPFRPGGDLSREADEIVNMIRGGKPITPTEDRTIGNGSAHADDNCNGGTVIGESVTKTNLSQNQATAQNGTNSHAGKLETGGEKSATSADQSNGGGGGANNGVTNLGQVSKQVVPGPTSASHVVIDEKKNKKKGCCVIQ